MFYPRYLLSKAINLWIFCAILSVRAADIARVDLVFPQNATYKSTPLMPVVFSIQQPQLVKSLYPTLEYSISEIGGKLLSTANQLPIRNLKSDESDSSSYLFEGLANIFRTDGQYELRWSLRWINCSRSIDGSEIDAEHTPEDEAGFHRRTYRPQKRLVFTIDAKGIEASLTRMTCPAHSNEKVAASEVAHGFVFDIKDSLKVPLALADDGVSSCALLASPAPTVGPSCQQTVQPDAVSSVLASLTKAECHKATPAVSCPPDENSADRIGAMSRVLATSVVTALISIAF